MCARILRLSRVKITPKIMLLTQNKKTQSKKMEDEQRLYEQDEQSQQPMYFTCLNCQTRCWKYTGFQPEILSVFPDRYYICCFCSHMIKYQQIRDRNQPPASSLEFQISTFCEAC